MADAQPDGTAASPEEGGRAFREILLDESHHWNTSKSRLTFEREPLRVLIRAVQNILGMDDWFRESHHLTVFNDQDPERDTVEALVNDIQRRFEQSTAMKERRYQRGEPVNWESVTLTLTHMEAMLLSRVFCIIRDLDERGIIFVTPVVGPAPERSIVCESSLEDMTWLTDDDATVVRDLWNRMLLVPRRSHAGKKSRLTWLGWRPDEISGYDYQPPDYRDEKYHSTA